MTTVSNPYTKPSALLILQLQHQTLLYTLMKNGFLRVQRNLCMAELGGEPRAVFTAASCLQYQTRV